MITTEATPGPGRPTTGRNAKRLISFHHDVSSFLTNEKVRTGKNMNRIMEDLLRIQMALKPDGRSY